MMQKGEPMTIEKMTRGQLRHELEMSRANVRMLQARIYNLESQIREQRQVIGLCKDAIRAADDYRLSLANLAKSGVIMSDCG